MEQYCTTQKSHPTVRVAVVELNVSDRLTSSSVGLSFSTTIYECTFGFRTTNSASKEVCMHAQMRRWRIYTC